MDPIRAQDLTGAKAGERIAPQWRLAIAFVAAAVIAVIAILAAAGLARIPGEEITPSGLKRNQALYVAMEDGAAIAIDIWLPEGHAPGQKLPAILNMTRYQRAQDISWLQRAFSGLGLTSLEHLPGLPVQLFNDAGYAFIIVDARGSGASFGHRTIEMSPREIADYGEIAEWITRQPWSNGKVGAVGISYEGNTAELLAATRHPAVKAVAPLYNDFDAQYGLVQPGGASSAFLDAWGDTVGAMDRNDVCALREKRGIACWTSRLWAPGVKPVDGPEGRRLLKAALREHERNTPVAEGFKRIQYRDDQYGSSGLTTAAVSGYGRREEIEASGVPFHVRTGWLDAATTDGALSRYRTFSNPQELVIGPYSHGGRTDSDPFSDPETPVAPSVPEQWKSIIAFFDKTMGGDRPRPVEKSITYYTMGAGVWRETDVWPPQGLADHTLYFSADGALAENAPEDETASDHYRVDMDASSGRQTRWHTNLGLGDVVYPDRAEQGERLLTYTSAPLTQDLEITGTPVLTFHVRSSTEDAVFHAYLEAAAPDGQVVYVTEGILRARHRNISSEAPVYVQDGPNHSFLRKDAAPLKPGETAEISIGLYATSVVIPEGWRIRIALAGADRSIFNPIPANETPEWNVYHGASFPSRLVLPARAFTQ